jgi:CheY-like chemotaxis protein
MDHMMPEMDGVEAAAEIRRMKGSRFKNVPIVALTANAVSGMREFFLKNGFSDYLAKPIEIPKLNEVMEKWIPADKRQNPENLPGAPARRPAPFEIDGLDAARGLAMTGNSPKGYLEVLALYCKDAGNQLKELKSMPDENNLPPFITRVHALKSASASIGAAEISSAAAALEDVGRLGRIDLIERRLPWFAEKLEILIQKIGAAIAIHKARAPEEGGFDREAALRLKAALEAESIGLIDKTLDELSDSASGGEVSEIIADISGDVLVSDFDKAIRAVNRLLEAVPDE